jgi:hypothetical protein
MKSIFAGVVDLLPAALAVLADTIVNARIVQNILFIRSLYQ